MLPPSSIAKCLSEKVKVRFVRLGCFPFWEAVRAAFWEDCGRASTLTSSTRGWEAHLAVSHVVEVSLRLQAAGGNESLGALNRVSNRYRRQPLWRLQKQLTGNTGHFSL